MHLHQQRYLLWRWLQPRLLWLRSNQLEASQKKVHKIQKVRHPNRRAESTNSHLRQNLLMAKLPLQQLHFPPQVLSMWMLLNQQQPNLQLFSHLQLFRLQQARNQNRVAGGSRRLAVSSILRKKSSLEGPSQRTMLTQTGSTGRTTPSRC